MVPKNRIEQFTELFPTCPSFRLVQVRQAFFDRQISEWKEVTVLPSAMRTTAGQIPWFSFIASEVFTSQKKDTYKALLELSDSKKIETVLMANKRGNWTICVSSQVGCAMACAFCATGKMGLMRNLTHDEIVDQYRFWNIFLREHPELPQRISNVVFMGMGEPMANYDAVKEALKTWLRFTDIGPTHITVSTVGVLPRLDKLLDDPEWPKVRLAISLHSADPKTRKSIVPTSYDDFLPKLHAWAKKYLAKMGSRRHHVTFEYVMLSGINDTPTHAKLLAEFVNDIGRIKVNLIPYNFTDSEFVRSTNPAIQQFLATLQNAGVIATTRRTMGDDIAAACGQLVVKNAKKTV